MMTALVGQDHTIEGVTALVEAERAQINPCRAAHLLIDAELCLLSLMPHGVVGVVDAARHSLIAHIDGVVSFFGNRGLIGNLIVVRATAGCLRHTGCACYEGILTVYIRPIMKGKAGLWRLLPRLAVAGLDVVHQVLVVIVVDNHLMALPVTLSWCEDNGTGILEHRD